MGEAAQKRTALGLVSPDGKNISDGPKLSHPVTRDGHCIPFFPVGKRVIVERLPKETTVLGGLLHIPETHQAPQQYATLIAAGPQAQDAIHDMGLQIGDTICFGRYAGLFFEWQPDGTASMTDRRRVDMIDAGDILGGKELAEKIFTGERAIMLHTPEGGGASQYRFFDEKQKG